jgi:hypothetical protein
MCQFAFLKSLKTVQSRSRTPLTAIALIAGSLLPLQVTEPIFQREIQGNVFDLDVDGLPRTSNLQRAPRVDLYQPFFV